MTDDGANWCGREACPACQGYDVGPKHAPDCPWLGEPLPAAITKDL